MAPLNISVDDPDPELGVVQRQIIPALLTQVTDAQGDNSLDTVVKANQGCAIDLIAHSADGVLQFASWSMSSVEAVSAVLRAGWPAGTPTQIRLLGCNTAYTTAGIAAMKHLAQVFGVPVYGTVAPIYGVNFDDTGFSSPDLLQAASALPDGAQRVTTAVIDRWFARFKRSPLTLGDVRANLIVEQASLPAEPAAVTWSAGWDLHLFDPDSLGALFARLREGVATAPGLLAIPDAEGMYPVAGGFVRASFLLGGAFVRLYPQDRPDGVLIRMPGTSQLAGGSRVTVRGTRTARP